MLLYGEAEVEKEIRQASDRSGNTHKGAGAIMVGMNTYASDVKLFTLHEKHPPAGSVAQLMLR